MASPRARRLSPVLALLVMAVAAALVDPQALAGIGENVTSHATSLRVASPAVEAVLPLKPEQAGDRVVHPGGSRHRLPLGLAPAVVGLPALAVALRARRGSRLAVARPSWFSVPPSRGPPPLLLVAT